MERRMMEIPRPSKVDESQALRKGGYSPASTSRLLSLPAELRTEIFALALADVRCRRPLVVWDDVCTGISGRTQPVSTAILQACRTTYDDCVSILYDCTTIEITIRSDSQDQSFPRFQICLGAIENCPLLPRLRHVELEVAYTCHEKTIARASYRIRRLADTCKNLKTIDLIFFDQSRVSPNAPIEQTTAADRIVEASRSLECERFVGISRNLAARRNMGPLQWLALRSRVDGYADDDEHGETFRELSFDYLEHAFRQKN